jgi:hypothetical protein
MRSPAVHLGPLQRPAHAVQDAAAAELPASKPKLNTLDL